VARRFIPLIGSLALLSGCGPRDAIDFPVLEGPYLGQSPPSDTAMLFAPGIVTTAHHEHSSAIFSPDGKELFWSVVMTPLQSPVPHAIMHMRLEGGRWTRPEVASFSGRYSEDVSSFSPDGDTLYFHSRRPTSGTGDPQDNIDIWKVARSERGWTAPERLDAPIGGARTEAGAQLTSSGTLYFDVGTTQEMLGIYRSRRVDGGYETPQPLGPTINSEHLDWTPYVDPDERFIVFSSDRPGGYGGPDLYVSFAQEDGEWGEAFNLGPKVNSEFNDRLPSVSPDGKYLFFLSSRTSLPRHFRERQTLARMLETSRSITNGLGNIYWIDAGILQRAEQDAAAR